MAVATAGGVGNVFLCRAFPRGRRAACVMSRSREQGVARLVLADHAGALRMPAAEGALLALRALAPTLADQVLERARQHYGDI